VNTKLRTTQKPRQTKMEPWHKETRKRNVQFCESLQGLIKL